MRKFLERMRLRIAGFRKADDAVAAVEFALILPFLITLYFGSIEASSLLTVDRRVTTVTGTVGDLVAQWDGTISTATVDSYFQAAKNIMQPYSTTNLKQVVSVISVNGTTGAMSVIWSRGNNGGVAKIAGNPYTGLATTAEMNKVARTVGYLVVAESNYVYRPVFGVVFPQALTLNRTNYYIPRFGAKICLDTTTC